MEYSKHSKYTASLYTLYTVYITYKLNSLIPTPSFLIAYSGRERPGHLLCEWHQCLPSRQSGGEGRSLTVRMSWKPLLIVFVQALEFQTPMKQETFHSLFGTKNACLNTFFWSVTPSVYVPNWRRHWRHLHNKWPCLLLPFLHTVIDQKLDSGKAWERG